MGRCVLTIDGFARVRELLPSMLVGRSPRCDLVVAGRDVPAYWLELRWLGDVWAWRELTPMASLRPAGDALTDGWRALRVGGAGARGTRLRWTGASSAAQDSLELVDAAAPEALVVDLHTNQPSREGLALVERRADGDYLLDEDAQPTVRLEPEAVFVARGRAWRLVTPGAIPSTVRGGLSVQDPEVGLRVGVATVTVERRGRTVTVDGEFVRTLRVYASARVGDPRPEGGWLGVREAFEAWLALGGNTGSPAERLGWDRGKLRTALAEVGVGGVGELFEVARSEGTSRCRLTLSAERLVLV